MDFLKGKTADMLTKLAGVGTGFIAWETAATAKYNNPLYYPNYPGPFSVQRFADALSGIIGVDATKALLGPSVSGWQAQGMRGIRPNPIGAINKISMTGVGLYIINQILKDAIPQYRHFDAIPELIDAVAAGLGVGGAIGGALIQSQAKEQDIQVHHRQAQLEKPLSSPCTVTKKQENE